MKLTGCIVPRRAPPPAAWPPPQWRPDTGQQFKSKVGRYEATAGAKAAESHRHTTAIHRGPTRAHRPRGRAGMRRRLASGPFLPDQGHRLSQRQRQAHACMIIRSGKLLGGETRAAPVRAASRHRRPHPARHRPAPYMARTHKSRTPRAIQRSSRGCRSGAGAALIFGGTPIEVCRSCVNHGHLTQRHLQAYPVASCRLCTLLPGSPAPLGTWRWPVDLSTAGKPSNSSCFVMALLCLRLAWEVKFSGDAAAAQKLEHGPATRGFTPKEKVMSAQVVGAPYGLPTLTGRPHNFR